MKNNINKKRKFANNYLQVCSANFMQKYIRKIFIWEMNISSEISILPNIFVCRVRVYNFYFSLNVYVPQNVQCPINWFVVTGELNSYIYIVNRCKNPENIYLYKTAVYVCKIACNSNPPPLKKACLNLDNLVICDISSIFIFFL